MKYIVVRATSSNGVDDVQTDIPVIFADSLVHKDVANYTCHMLMFDDQNVTSNTEVISAGFVELLPFRCHGRSDSIGIDSRGQLDTELMLRYEFTSGAVEC